MDASPDYISTASSGGSAGVVWSFLDAGIGAKVGNMTTAGSTNRTFSGQATVGTIWLTVTSEFGVSAKVGKTIIILPTGVSPTSGVKNPDTITEATAGEPESLDPAYDYESAGIGVINQVYETLLWYNGTSADDLKPILATNIPSLADGTITNGGKDYTFHLRPNVKFHDGTIMNAQDVIYSIKRVLLSNNAYSPAWMLGQTLIPNYYDYDISPSSSTATNPIPEALIDASMEAKDNNMTVVFHLVSPYPAFNKIMAFSVASVVSKAFVVAHGGSPVLGRNQYMDTHEMGTGPYQLNNWVKSQYVKMTAFSGYWGVKAKTQNVVISDVLTYSTRKMLLDQGDADMIYVPRNKMNDIINQQGQVVNPNNRVSMGNVTFTLDFMGFNVGNITPGLDNGNIPAWFYQDVNIRKAFVHAFNDSKYISEVMKGTAIQPNGYVPKGMFGYNASVPVYNFDPQLAAQYLKQAIDNRTGVSYAEEGFRLVLYFNNGNEDREGACKILADGLSSLSKGQGKLGLINGTIEVTYKGQDWSTTYLPNQRAGKFGIFMLGWLPDYPDPDDYAQPFLQSGGTFAYTCHIKNTTIDAWVAAAATELNEKARASLYYNISMWCYENAYYMWTDQPTNFHVERTWVQGYYYNPTFSEPFFAAIYKSTVK